MDEGTGIASQKRAHAMADARMTIVSETSSDPEMYILMMEEAVYLVVCDQKLLQVRGSQGNILTIQDLWQQCRLARQSKATLDASEFAIQFAVYRYYQSQGWIVKSGHLFGADYVLYRDGPTRKHSEYAVMVLPVLDAESKSKRPTWQSVQMASRVCSHARKSIILCHVIIPRMLDMSRIECIESIQIWDVAIGRWKPEKGRR
ncbi:translational activator of GCN4 [Batrachochytrium dendrobatidis]